MGRDACFEALKVKCIKFGPFYLQTGLLSLELSVYDAVIFMADIRWPVSLVLCMLLRNKVRTILWGAWRTNRRMIDPLKVWFLNRVDARLFYCLRHVNEFREIGMKSNSNYVAINTFHIENPVDLSECEKDSFLFVGKLSKRKRLDLVIDAVAQLRVEGVIAKLNIVGLGDCEEELMSQIERLDLQEQITFHGTVISHPVLQKLYKSAYACISPGQAGLSVLQSMAMGVPFITYKDAVTGGESDSISSGINGILLEKLDSREVKRVLKDLVLGRLDSEELGHSAYRYYQENASMKNMVSGFIESIRGEKC